MCAKNPVFYVDLWVSMSCLRWFWGYEGSMFTVFCLYLKDKYRILQGFLAPKRGLKGRFGLQKALRGPFGDPFLTQNPVFHGVFEALRSLYDVFLPKIGPMGAQKTQRGSESGPTCAYFTAFSENT